MLNVPNGGLLTGQTGAFVGFSEDGKKIATGGFDTPTTLWDLEAGKQILNMKGHTNMAYKVAFNADSTQLSSGGRTRWDLRTGRGLRIAATPSEKMIVVPSPDGRLLAAYTLNSNASQFWKHLPGRQLQTLKPATAGAVVQSVNFSPDGTIC